jgi:hypothetical protein
MTTANRNFDFVQGLGKKTKIIEGSFAPNGRVALSAASVKGKGFSVLRTGGGLYEVTLDDYYYDLISAVVSLQLSSGDDKIVQFQGAINPNPVSGTKKAVIASWDISATDQPEISTVQCVADVASSLNNKYFLLYSANDMTGYYVWFNVAGAGVDPAIAGKTGVQVAIAAGAAAAVVAAAVQVAVDALADFVATVLVDTVTITNAANGQTTDASDGAAPTGFTILVTQQGDAHLQDIAANANNRINFKIYLKDSSLA